MKSFDKIIIVSLMFSFISVAQETVNYEDLEEYPYFEKCEKKFKKKPEACFLNQLQKHFGKTFSYPDIFKEKNIQGRYDLELLINDNGEVTLLSFEGIDMDNIMKNEFKKVLNSLPKATPGKINAKNVITKMKFPIVLKLK